MTLTQAIERAIEGGWNTGAVPLPYEHTPYLQVALLDPSFWKALGKVEGWKTAEPYQKQPYMRLHTDGTVTREDHPVLNEWEINMHRMIDALADGKSLEAFFETL